MNKISCKVMDDLLPLYADEAVSEDTRALVEEHLSGCSRCREELKKLREPLVLPDPRPAREQDADNLKKLRGALSRKRRRAALLAVCLTLLVLAIGWLLRQPRSLEAALGDDQTFAAGQILVQSELGHDRTLVLYENKYRQELQLGVLEKQGPFWRSLHRTGSLALAEAGPLEEGDLRANLMISWYDREHPERCVLAGIAYDEEVDRISYAGEDLQRADVSGLTLFYGTSEAEYEVYRLFDENGRELEHIHGFYVD